MGARARLQSPRSADRSKSEYSTFIRSQNLVGGLIEFKFLMGTQCGNFRQEVVMMKESSYKSYDELPLFLSTKKGSRRSPAERVRWEEEAQRNE